MKLPHNPTPAASSTSVPAGDAEGMMPAEALSTLSSVFDQEAESLLSSSAVIQKVLDCLPSVVGYWDNTLKNRLANKAYEAWFGVEASQLRGKYIWELLGDELYRLNLPHIEGALRGEPQTFERIIPNADSSCSRHSLTNYIPDVRDGEVKGFFCAAHRH